MHRNGTPFDRAKQMFMCMKRIMKYDYKYTITGKRKILTIMHSKVSLEFFKRSFSSIDRNTLPSSFQFMSNVDPLRNESRMKDCCVELESLVREKLLHPSRNWHTSKMMGIRCFCWKALSF